MIDSVRGLDDEALLRELRRCWNILCTGYNVEHLSFQETHAGTMMPCTFMLDSYVSEVQRRNWMLPWRNGAHSTRVTRDLHKRCVEITRHVMKHRAELDEALDPFRMEMRQTLMEMGIPCDDDAVSADHIDWMLFLTLERKS